MTSPEGLKKAHQHSLWTPYFQMQTTQEKGPLIFERADGVHVYDVDGKEYLDAHASLWLANVGYNREEIIEAVHEQMKQMPFFSMFMGWSNPTTIALAEHLVEMAAPEGMGKVFFSNSGSEAVETALKMARQYWRNVGRAGKYKVISRHYAYHGVTMGALSAMGLTGNRKNFEPLVPGFRHIPAPNVYRNPFGEGLSEEQVSEAAAKALRDAIMFEGPDSVAAFIAEPVQGAGGVIIPPESYLRRCRAICDEFDVLFIADEVVTGFGRTGTMFGARTYGFKPDIMTFAKGLTSGYIPMGATMCSNKIYDAFLSAPQEGKQFLHGNTYAGHATAAAAAIANLAILERENLADNAAKIGAYFLERLRGLDKYPIVGDIRGVGLLARVELVADKETRQPFDTPGANATKVHQLALNAGVLFRNVGDVLTFSPPLTITEEHADQIVDTIDRAIAEVVDGL